MQLHPNMRIVWSFINMRAAASYIKEIARSKLSELPELPVAVVHFPLSFDLIVQV